MALLDLGGEPHGAPVAHRPLQVLPLDVERRQLAPVGQPHPPPAGDVVRDLPDRPDRVLQAQVAENDVVLEHLEEGRRGPHLHQRDVLRHVRVAGDDVEPPVALGVGVGLVPGVDDGPAPGGGRRDPLPDVLCPLRQAEHGSPRRLEELAGTGVDLAGDEERDQRVDHPLEVAVAAHQVVLVAPVRVPGGVGVVLEEVDLPADALLLQPLLGRGQQALQDPLPRLVVGDHVEQAVALRGCVLGVAAHVEVQPGTVLEEDVGRPAPRHHPAEQVAGDLVG